MRFEFATATRIVFGPGTLPEIVPAVRACGTRALIVTGRSRERARPLEALFASQSVATVSFSVVGEPTTETVAAGVATARRAGCDVVVGFGGGSAIDAAKVIAAMLTNPGELLDYLEVIGRGQTLRVPPAPFLAVPTTAGTGSEVTRNAVIASPVHRVKASLRSPWLLARLAVVDPELARDLPPAITATTGLDALTQLIEPFVSCRAQPMTDALCREGLVRAARSLRRACDVPGDLAAREDMALASLCSGLALANAGLGAVHGFAAPIGGMFHAPHGAVCAALLPQAMDVNLRAVERRAPDAPVRGRFDEVARMLTGSASATARDGVTWCRDLVGALGVPGLRVYGLGEADAGTVCERAMEASSMKANPIALHPDELREIFLRSL
jgi:alcohol dehydrogenase class IV